MQHSHGKSISQIVDLAADVLTFARQQSPDIILRFSTEDTFRSRESDLLRVYLSIADLGLVNRLGVADTVGIATPQQVYAMVHQLVRLTGLDVEFHGHNDSGCAIANACAALEGGATHIDTTILGIGERNGITSLGGLIARLYTLRKDYTARYNLTLLNQIDHFVADICHLDIPFNNYITGASAFIHKAGIHAKAVLADPSTYEALRGMLCASAPLSWDSPSMIRRCAPSPRTSSAAPMSSRSPCPKSINCCVKQRGPKHDRSHFC
jgi:homocitrate synthase